MKATEARLARTAIGVAEQKHSGVDPLARQRKTPARDHLPTGGLWRSLALLPCSGELEHEQGLQGITDLVLGHFGVRSGDRPWRSLWTRVQSQSWSCTSGRAQEKELDTGNHMENK